MYFIIIFICCSQIHRDRNQNGDCQGTGIGTKGYLLFNGYRILKDSRDRWWRWLHNSKNVLNTIEVNSNHGKFYSICISPQLKNFK